MNIYSLLRKVKRSNLLGLRKYVNLMWYDPTRVILPLQFIDFVEVDGCRFIANDQIDSLQRVNGNEWFANIRPTDIGMDIGANIGAITIPLAKAATWVWAIEPLFYNELEANVKLNSLNNVTVMRCGLDGGNNTKHIEFSSKEGDSVVMPFATIKELVNEQIDWLKIDCEGYEWNIKPEELAGIREIRAELHIRRKSDKHDRQCAKEWIKWLKANDYAVKVDYGAKPPFSVPFSDCMLLIASKNEN